MKNSPRVNNVNNNNKPGICPGKGDAQNSLGLWDTNGSINLGQTTRPCNSQQ